MTAVLPETGTIDALDWDAEIGCGFGPESAKCGATPVTHRMVGVCACDRLLCRRHARIVRVLLRALALTRRLLRLPDEAVCERCGSTGPASAIRVVPL